MREALEKTGVRGHLGKVTQKPERSEFEPSGIGLRFLDPDGRMLGFALTGGRGQPKAGGAQFHAVFMTRLIGLW